MIPIGVQLRSYRIQQKKTRKAVAVASGVDYYHYCGIEKGQYSPTLYTLNRIAPALGLRLALVAVDGERSTDGRSLNQTVGTIPTVERITT